MSGVAPGENLKCPLWNCGEFHPTSLDKNGRVRISCPNWGITVWFNRGPRGQEYLEALTAEPVCPSCRRPVGVEMPALCPHCEDPLDPCPDCEQPIDPLGSCYCLRCGWNVREYLRYQESQEEPSDPAAPRPGF